MLIIISFIGQSSCLRMWRGRSDDVKHLPPPIKQNRAPSARVTLKIKENTHGVKKIEPTNLIAIFSTLQY